MAIGVGGVYYTPCVRAGEADHDAPVRVFNAATGKDRLFGILDEAFWPAIGRNDGAFAISPNGRTLLYNRTFIAFRGPEAHRNSIESRPEW